MWQKHAVLLRTVSWKASSLAIKTEEGVNAAFAALERNRG